MGRESNLWKRVREGMKDHWEATRIECHSALGVPDVYYTMKGSGSMGWLELKRLEEWPKRINTRIKIQHFTPQQRNFIKDHGKLGANVFMLLQVEEDHLLLTWKTCCYLYDGLFNKRELIQIAEYTCPGKLDFDLLSFILN